MKKYLVEHRKILASEYQHIRKTTNWSKVEDKVVKKALEKDLYSVCIIDVNNMVVGIGRVIGDGALYFYIQDVIVLPNFQGKGIGQLIMENIEAYINQNSNNNSFVGLMAADGVKDFYHRFGYLERSLDKPGMYKYISKDTD